MSTTLFAACTADGFEWLSRRRVGAGQCAFWFDAGFGPTFSADCNRLHLATAWDNCTGGRGYLNSPGEDLIRRVP